MRFSIHARSTDLCATQTTSNINKWNYVQEINQDKPLAVLSSDSVSWYSRN